MSDSPRKSRRVVTEEDLDALYELLKGARYANHVMDARAAVERKDYEKAQQLLSSVHERHAASHAKTTRTIEELEQAGSKDGQTRARRLRKKHDQNEHALAELTWMVERLDRMVDFRTDEPEKEVVVLPSHKKKTAADVLQILKQELAEANNREEQLRVIHAHYEIVPISSEDPAPESLYCYHRSEDVQIIRTGNGPFVDAVEMMLALTGQSFQPVTPTKFIELGKKNRLQRLKERSLDADSDAGPSLASEGFVDEQRDEVLDMGAFSQLCDAAQRCGLVPSVDVIAHTRDREFRLGNYEKAYQTIEGVYAKFTALATQRDQRLRQEEIEIKSGRVKISPKKLQEKRQRDTMETQNIDRARQRFMRVLEGLRVLMRTD